jgi:hypothetical protein
MARAAVGGTHANLPLTQRIIGGVVGGVAGGLVFGAMMAMMGMLPMVASVVGSKSAMVGFIYHMFNSVIIGIAFGLLNLSGLIGPPSRVRVHSPSRPPSAWLPRRSPPGKVASPGRMVRRTVAGALPR